MQETVVFKAEGEIDEEQPHFLIIGSAGPGKAVMRGIARDAAPPDLFDTDDRLNDPRNN